MMNEKVFEFNTFPKLKTERYVLREAEMSDYISIFEIYNDEKTAKYQQFPTMESYDQTMKTIDRFILGFRNGKFIRWCITTEDNNVIGFITLHKFDFFNNKCEIGFMLNSNFWRQGIMSEAANEVIRYVFDELGFEIIEASVHPKNNASIKLIEKLKFIRKLVIKESAYNSKVEQYEDRLLYSLGRS